MNASQFRSRLKPWILPLAMLTGALAHNHIGLLAPLAPYLIFVMLFIAFCRINPRQITLGRLSWRLLMVQLVGSMALYFVLLPVDETLAQGAFICVFCPTATAAPVITGLLGGSVSRLVSYSLVSNIAVASLAPGLFTMMGSGHMDYFDSVRLIAMRVVPLIVAPLVAAFVLSALWPRAHKAVASHQGLSFYVWAVSLIIVVGQAVSFVLAEPPAMIPVMIALAVLSGLACVGQFYVGRRIGRGAVADPVSGGQGLGQKNTVLAVWMAMTYLNPVSSVAPAAYVAWQNTINSIQIYMHQRRETKVGAKQ